MQGEEEDDSDYVLDEIPPVCGNNDENVSPYTDIKIEEEEEEEFIENEYLSSIDCNVREESSNINFVSRIQKSNDSHDNQRTVHEGIQLFNEGDRNRIGHEHDLVGLPKDSDLKIKTESIESEISQPEWNCRQGLEYAENAEYVSESTQHVNNDDCTIKLQNDYLEDGKGKITSSCKTSCIESVVENGSPVTMEEETVKVEPENIDDSDGEDIELCIVHDDISSGELDLSDSISEGQTYLPNHNGGPLISQNRKKRSTNLSDEDEDTLKDKTKKRKKYYLLLTSFSSLDDLRNYLRERENTSQTTVREDSSHSTATSTADSSNITFNTPCLSPQPSTSFSSPNRDGTNQMNLLPAFLSVNTLPNESSDISTLCRPTMPSSSVLPVASQASLNMQPQIVSSLSTPSSPSYLNTRLHSMPPQNTRTLTCSSKVDSLNSEQTLIPSSKNPGCHENLSSVSKSLVNTSSSAKMFPNNLLVSHLPQSAVSANRTTKNSCLSHDLQLSESTSSTDSSDEDLCNYGDLQLQSASLNETYEPTIKVSSASLNETSESTSQLLTTSLFEASQPASRPTHTVLNGINDPDSQTGFNVTNSINKAVELTSQSPTAIINDNLVQHPYSQSLSASMSISLKKDLQNHLTPQSSPHLVNNSKAKVHSSSSPDLTSVRVVLNRLSEKDYAASSLSQITFSSTHVPDSPQISIGSQDKLQRIPSASQSPNFTKSFSLPKSISVIPPVFSSTLSNKNKIQTRIAAPSSSKTVKQSIYSNNSASTIRSDYADNFCEDSNHMVVHSHNWKFLCKVCGMSFKRKSDLTSHSFVHSNELPFQSEHCGKCNKRKVNIYQHMLDEHSLDAKQTICRTSYNKLPCKACGKSFKSKDTFNTHLLMHKVGYCNNVSDTTTSSMLYSCHECKKFFRTKSYLIKHMIRIHFREKIFTCDTCLKSFKTKDYLYKHIAIHNNRKFSCEVCGKTFKAKNTLNVHLLVHSDQCSFHCEHCDNCFKSKYNIYRHIINVHVRQYRSVRKEKKFSCKICNLSFISTWKLNRHMCTHYDIRKFSCNDCGQKFSQKDYLTLHLSRKNHIEIYERKCS